MCHYLHSDSMKVMTLYSIWFGSLVTLSDSLPLIRAPELLTLVETNKHNTLNALCATMNTVWPFILAALKHQ